MKKEATTAILLFLALFLAPYALAESDIRIGLIEQNPSPAKLGSSFRLLIKVENIGDSALQDVTCTATMKYWLSGENEKSTGVLYPDSKKTIEYSLSVDDDAVAGSYKIPVVCTSGSQEESYDVLINIESKYGALNIKEVKTDPEVVEPGQKAELYITLKNNADSIISQISIDLNLSGVDIAPYNGSTQRRLTSISAGSSETINFGIIVLPGIAGGIYKIPIELEYIDATSKSYEVANYVSVEVGSKPEIDASVDSTTMYGSKSMGDVTLKVVNRGLTDLKLLNIRIVENDNVDVLSNENVYIGDLDSDDYETAEFTLGINKFVKNEATIPLLLEFRDSSNNFYSVEKEIKFRRPTAAEVGKGGPSIWLIIAALAVAAYIYHRYRKKRHQQR